jgi:hypothetical protein
MPSVSLKYTPDLAYPLFWLQFIPDSWDISRTTPVLLFLAPGTIASAGGLFYAIVTHAAAGVCLIGAVVIGVAIFWIEATLEKMTAAWLILRVERRLARDLRPRAFSILQLSTGANGGFGSEMAQHEPVARIVPLYRNQMAGKCQEGT